VKFNKPFRVLLQAAPRGTFQNARRPHAGKAAYWKYLQSMHWQETRDRKLAQAAFCCEYIIDHEGDGSYGEAGSRCNRYDHLEVHHLSYFNLGHEKLEDLQVLCRFHHLVTEIKTHGCSRCRAPFYADADDLEFDRDFTAVEMVTKVKIGNDNSITEISLDDFELPRLCGYCEKQIND
jgi:hypothetical protein